MKTYQVYCDRGNGNELDGYWVLRFAVSLLTLAEKNRASEKSRKKLKL